MNAITLAMAAVLLMIAVVLFMIAHVMRDALREHRLSKERAGWGYMDSRDKCDFCLSSA